MRVILDLPDEIALSFSQRERKIDAVDLDESVHLIARPESKDTSGLRIRDLRRSDAFENERVVTAKRPWL